MVFFFNRYVITPLLLIPFCIPDFLFPISISFCKYHFYLSLCLPLLNLGTAELIIILRVCSLYGHRKLIAWSLGVFFVVNQVMFAQSLETVFYYQFLPGCWLWPDKPSFTQLYVWAVFLSFEGILMLLTAYKVFSYRNQMNRTISVLSRDSIVYFVIIFATILINVIFHLNINVTISFQFPGQCITSIAVGRMMMNIRGLMMDDPQYIEHLQTLQFAREPIWAR